MNASHAVTTLAQDYRLAAFRLLFLAGNEGLAAAATAEKLAVLPSSLSFHFALMTASLDDMRLQNRLMEIGSRDREPAVN